jgi:hypothetical protein
MANQVTIKPETNKVELTDQRRQITVTDNRTGTSINLTQTNPQVIQINTPGPQGAIGTATTSGSFSGSFQGDGSGLTGIVASGSIDSSSFAETASLALNLDNNFTYSGNIFTVQGDIFVQGTLDASTKNFKIDHPTKPDYYLVHSSLEGPERGIYYRGKLLNTDIISLPEYWEALVEEKNITVQLTPINNSCTHYVKSINNKEIKVGCKCGQPHCFYIVHAERNNEGKFEILQPKQIKSL